MPVPTAYTEAELATYMHDELGAITTNSLSWVNPGSYANAIIKVLFEMGVSDISEVLPDEIPKLLSVAKVMALRAAVTQIAGKYDFMTDSQSFRRDQQFKHLKEALSIAESDAYIYGVGDYEVESIPITDSHNPYDHHIKDEFRVLP